jgi:hypothetical protein
LYEALYRQQPLPYALFEVRFTPAGHDRTLVGAGRDRRSTWIDLVLDDSRGFERYYAAAESLIKQIGARPHLGKFCQNITSVDLQNAHGASFTQFQQLVQQYDPTGKFKNSLTRRIF